MTHLKNITGALVVGSITLLTQGCGADFAPESYLNGLRVLAIEASPPEVGLQEEITLTPRVFSPAEQPVTSHQWRFCPLSLGAAQGFACAVPQCEVPLKADGDGVISMTPAAALADCLILLGNPAAGATPGNGPIDLPEQIESAFSYRVGTGSGEFREAVARVPLWLDSPPEQRNRAPQILSVGLDGAAVEAGARIAPVEPGRQVEVRVRVDPSSLDQYTDEAGRARSEQPIVSFFASAGRFKYFREEGVDTRGTWEAIELEAGQGEAAIYVVVRDLRGGQTVAGPFLVPLMN